MNQTARALLPGACLIVAMSGASAAVIESRFDTGGEGWTTGSITRTGLWFAIDPAVASPVNYDPARQLIQTYDVFPWTTFRSSPAYGGNRSAFFGGSISYDLSDAANDPGMPYPNIAILARSGDMIFIPTTAPNTTGFTHYDFALDSSAGWLTTFLGRASDTYIRTVLADVDGIWINADWKTGDESANDDSRLDNVCLRDPASVCDGRPVPVPKTLALLGAGLMLLGLWRRTERAGQVLKDD
ncbi:hypothetical protein [Accumulibacter sp.]|uniref:hypothetical protein n=1 Tax=Accumulibacter sp. TaxID=2053492 RepID=UPI0025DA1CF6|nr:hypothetical protein [Accumulibacter sp.]MCM8594954.1 hypothetical protein [Accumulibacter sp.]MCM8624351.1 hypothetical protein [Accumulibacter sp.]MDS4049100.1 hypothetical protein [Accumulibacter sp.]